MSQFITNTTFNRSQGVARSQQVRSNPGRPACGCNCNRAAYRAFAQAARQNMEPATPTRNGSGGALTRYIRNNPQAQWVGRNITKPVVSTAAEGVGWLGRNVGKPVGQFLQGLGILD